MYEIFIIRFRVNWFDWFVFQWIKRNWKKGKRLVEFSRKINFFLIQILPEIFCLVGKHFSIYAWLKFPQTRKLKFPFQRKNIYFIWKVFSNFFPSVFVCVAVFVFNVQNMAQLHWVWAFVCVWVVITIYFQLITIQVSSIALMMMAKVWTVFIIK